MKSLVLILCGLFSAFIYSQEIEDVEFLPINLDGKEAFLSTKTGEYIYRDHADTDVTKLITTESGVIYTDIKTHKVAKRETISKIAKKYGLTKAELIKQNELSSTKLSIGQELNIIKKLVVKSSSPVISQGESKIIARLHPGQTPTGLDAAPPSRAPITNQTSVVKIPETNEKDEVVPNVTTDGFYTVKKGDNLYSISKKNGITVEELKKINNLTTNNLSIGQKLKLK